MTTPTNRPRRNMCSTVSMHQMLLEQNPELRERRAEVYTEIGRAIESGRAARVAQEVVTIPVVVHVVAATDEQDISDKQVASQIESLNLDYRRKNPDAKLVPDVWADLAADTRIEFELATKDPSGAATDGIVRVHTDRTSFRDVDNPVKFDETGGSTAWPSDRYLNLWVCNLAGGLLGYAQFPGMPAETDGVVILYTAFGTIGSLTPEYDRGRTATHEIGHWLNLRHIWGDENNCSGTDFVADTPKAQLPNYGTPSFPHVSCGNGPNGDMFMNYMDYTDDVAMFMFTAGQSERMNATLAGPRSSFRDAAAPSPA
ncbi:zinc metalloprotease [Actinomycetospora sp. C-140]